MTSETSAKPSALSSVSSKSSDKPPKATKQRERRSPASLALKQILKMPLGELTKFANELATNRETAEFLKSKLDAALADGKAE